MTVDVACFRYPESADGAAPQNLIGVDGGLVVVGSAKLGQRVIVELLTEAESQDYSGRGTSFLTRLRTGTYTETDVLVAFQLSKPVLKGNLQAEELSTDPAAERYLDSYVDQLIVVTGGVEMRLNVVSRAGLTTVVRLPIMVFRT